MKRHPDEGWSYISSLDFPTIVANSLEDLLDLGHESVMKDWRS